MVPKFKTFIVALVEKMSLKCKRNDTFPTTIINIVLKYKPAQSKQEYKANNKRVELLVPSLFALAMIITSLSQIIYHTVIHVQVQFSNQSKIKQHLTSN